MTKKSSNLKMKNILLIIILITSPILLKTYSQTNLKIDKQYGFCNFKLNDSFETWQNEIIKDKNPDRYSYIGANCDSIYGCDISKIFLDFKDDKLISITIFLIPLNSNEIINLEKNLNNNLGSSSDSEYIGAIQEKSTFWKGDKNILILDVLNPSKKFENKSMVYLMFSFTKFF